MAETCDWAGPILSILFIHVKKVFGSPQRRACRRRFPTCALLLSW
jgi:hypothetical protein